MSILDLDRKEVKCVVIGDGAAGKTCMLVTYSTHTFPTAYNPTLYDVYKLDVPVTGFGDVRTVALSLWDVAGQEDFKDTRAYSYRDVDAFILCFSLSSRDSYDNVATIWLPELKAGEHTRDKPILLVGTMVDLRGTDEGGTQISTEEGEAMRDRIGAFKYVECSSMAETNLKEVFDSAIVHVLQKGKGTASAEGKGRGRWWPSWCACGGGGPDSDRNRA